ncbi:PREDICTED: protein ECERIFERUM 26-like [Camelina sativa]|uniref:Protein ECERIFERUM 26-like n=1 Tax=Camelina sativa TaxID=90675 RepID=A0ABM0XNB8_CAMSA|nr:PREDICTED: protein ECERIFERUM 26-like [Camelina sativa]XP_010512967.1 PREDICTED: protein ECERIFERUM 26-like [Camelina sativa]
MGRVQEEGRGPVHGFRLSTVSSSRPTETGTTHELTGLDLAMKLHYLKVVYIYSAETASDLTVMNVKAPLFPVFDQISWITGRLRRHESGRPYIKCNDCGTRFVESHCDLTVDEWLRVPDRSVDESLVYHQPVGPEMAFSPLIYIQMTRFSCGGLALGLSWAHIMGDPLSLSHVFNLWARAYVGEKIHCPKTSELERVFQNPNSTGKEPESIKRVDPVGDLWVAPGNNKMTTFSFNLTVNEIKSHFPATGENEFEILSGIIWKCIAKARGESAPVTITVIKSDPNGLKPRAVRNSQMISSVHVDFSVAEASLEEIVKSIGETNDERFGIDETVDDVTDFIVYGTNLTFVDLSGVDFYEAKVMGKSPESVYCNVQGIGDGGVVVVMPGGVEEEERAVTVTLSDDEIEKVKCEMNKCGLITVLVVANGE